MRQEFQVDIRMLEPPIAVVSLRGTVDSTSSAELETQLDGALDQGRDHVVINLSELDFMSTAGWSVLVAKLRRLRARKGALHLCCMSMELDEVYKLLEFEKLMPAHPTLEEALSAVRAGVAQ
jgi:anti-anti-sigma factor